MEENRFIVTINRECGTGGRAIADQLGRLLGVKVYGRDILDTITDNLNLTVEEIERQKAKRANWWDDFVNFYRQFTITPYEERRDDNRVTSLQIYNAEARLLRGLAEKESCIIVGRSGFHIFRDDPRALKILIIADEEYRTRSFAEKYGKTEDEARSIIHEVDEQRENFTKTFAGTSRYDARHYDLVCNVSNIDVELVTASIVELVRRRFLINK